MLPVAGAPPRHRLGWRTSRLTPAVRPGAGGVAHQPAHAGRSPTSGDPETMAPKNYTETFDNGPGGWVRVVDNVQPPAALPVREGALWSFGPWWVDYNHAPPGAGYLQLLMCLPTKGPFGEHYRETAGQNRFVASRQPLDFTNARFSVRLKGELEPETAKVCLLVQGSAD